VTPSMAIRPASDHALAVARTWPLLTTYDLSKRLAPDGTHVASWSIHIRCGWPDCAQSVLCTSNDSGAYVWSCRDQLLPGVLGHIYQCHRAQSGVDDD
jgi:hypothetical protein